METLQKGAREELYELFVTTWQSNIRVLMCANPVGDALRRTLRAYPSLVDCCHFDWYVIGPGNDYADH